MSTGDLLDDPAFAAVWRSGDVVLLKDQPGEDSEVMVFAHDDELLEWCEALQGTGVSDYHELATTALARAAYDRERSPHDVQQEAHERQDKLAELCADVGLRGRESASATDPASDERLAELVRRLGDPAVLYDRPRRTGDWLFVTGGIPDLSWCGGYPPLYTDLADAVRSVWVSGWCVLTDLPWYDGTALHLFGWPNGTPHDLPEGCFVPSGPAGHRLPRSVVTAG